MSCEDLDNPSVLTVCVVCTDTAAGEDGIGVGGELLAQLETLLADHAWCDRVRLVKHRCLMACTEGCVVSLTARGKMQYLLGRLSADRTLAAQVLDFAAMHADSITGITQNHEWPPLMAMHIIGRIPPVDPVDADWNDEGCNL